MIKRLLMSVLVILLSIASIAQSDTDSLINDETIDCEFIAQNSSSWIMYFYSIEEYDSAGIVLDNWQEACGLTEPILRTRILLAIRNNTYSEELYDSTIVDFLFNYMMRIDTTSPADLYSEYQDYFGNIPFRSDYDYFTQSIADELLQQVFYNPSELLFSEFYSNVLPDPVKAIQLDTTYKNTALRSYYYQRVDKYLKQPDYHISLYSGIWIPFENAALLGNHPVIGGQIGIRAKKMTYNLSFDFKFIKSKNEYTFLRNGNIDTTTNFSGLYLGADLEREIFTFRKNKISLLGGIGYDGFDAIKVDTEDNDPNNDVSQMIGSLNTNFGLGYRHFFKNKTYIGLQGKYNIVNYSNQGGTNFSGNCLTISVSVGGFFNEKKSYYLNELRYIE